MRARFLIWIIRQTEMKRFLCLRMAEIQSVSTQTDFLPGVRFLADGVIFGIADDGAAHVRQLYPDLMMAAGIQPDIQFGGVRIRMDRSIGGKEALPVWYDLVM